MYGTVTRTGKTVYTQHGGEAIEVQRICTNVFLVILIGLKTISNMQLNDNAPNPISKEKMTNVLM